MQNFRKSYCLYHPAEFITNFCKEKICQLPLCPSCIATHIDFHVKNKNNPQVDNIVNSLYNTYNELKEQTQTLQLQLKRIKSIEQKIKQMPNTLSQILLKSKLYLKEMIDRKFEEVQKESLALITRNSAESGLNHPQKLHMLQQKIQQYLFRLRSMIQQFETQKILNALINYNSKQKQNLDTFNYNINTELKRNQEYKSIININTAAYQDINNSINKILNIKFVFPENLNTSNPIALQSQQVEIPHPLVLINLSNYESQIINRQRFISPTIRNAQTRNSTPQLKTFSGTNSYVLNRPANNENTPNLLFTENSSEIKGEKKKLQKKSGITLQREIQKEKTSRNQKLKREKYLDVVQDINSKYYNTFT